MRSLNITVIGTGYVGLVTGTCLSELGHQVTCVDTNQEKINALLSGQVPIYEPGLEALLIKNRQKNRLNFASSLSEISKAEVYFIAVGTPSNDQGAADLVYVMQAAKDIAQHMQAGSLIINKSTVPVGTAEAVKKTIQTVLDDEHKTLDFDVASNPEFLKEGDAIRDFMQPERIVLGANNDASMDKLREVYAPMGLPNEKIVCVDVKAAEMIKYAANAMLATRISFMNEIADICDLYHVDVEAVKKGMSLDSRIGPYFLNAGCGYGGSCFPKDVKALQYMAKQGGFEPCLLDAVDQRNIAQKNVLFNKLKQAYPDLSGKKVALWGLAFKPETDDLREASSRVFIEQALEAGVSIQAYDPIAMKAVKSQWPSEFFNHGLSLADDLYQACEGVDAIVLATEWKQFTQVDIKRVKQSMKHHVVIDGRNVLNKSTFEAEGFIYKGVGR